MRVQADTNSTAGDIHRQVQNTIRILVPAAHGRAFKVPCGHRFRIIDIYGEQIVDMMAYPAQPDGSVDFFEKLSMAYTRYRVGGITPQVGESLWTNRDEPLLLLTADTVKVHDMTFMSCYPELYEKLGLEGHRSCAMNIAEALGPWGLVKHTQVAEPFNVFQNTPNYGLKPGLAPSRPGDYIEFEALKDVVVAVSSCPYDLDGFNGGDITDIEVVINP